MTFLSQSHYNINTLVDDDGFTGLILRGSYRLHHFAVNGWYELVKKYLQLTQNKPLPSELVHCLRTLIFRRHNDEFTAERDPFFKPAYLQPIKTEYPDLYHWYHVNEGISLIQTFGQRADCNRGQMEPV